MKRRLTAFFLCLVMLLPLLGCDRASIDDLAQQLGVSASDIASAADAVLTPEVSEAIDSVIDNVTQSQETTESTTQSTESESEVTMTNELPEALINFWEVREIYQEAMVSDISADQAMEFEKNNAMSIGYDAFVNHSGLYENPTYVVDHGASFGDMVGYGIQTHPLQDTYGDSAKVTSITVCDSNGQYITVLYWIADDVLIAFGKGMHVFSYKAVDAVG